MLWERAPHFLWIKVRGWEKKKSERLENWYTHSRNNEYIAKRGKRLEKCYSQSEGPLMSVHNLPVFLDELSDLY